MAAQSSVLGSHIKCIQDTAFLQLIVTNIYIFFDSISLRNLLLLPVDVTFLQKEARTTKDYYSKLDLLLGICGFGLGTF